MADCYEQISLVDSMSSEDPAMANTAETSSASKSSGNLGVMQRTEAKSRQRNYNPVKSGKAHITVLGRGLLQAGDSSCEKGGTQKLLTVHSHCEKRSYGKVYSPVDFED